LLRDVCGIVFGHLSLDRCEEDEFENFLLDLLWDFEGPILMDFPAGHEAPNLTLPLGTEVELFADDSTGWLAYREDALSWVVLPTTAAPIVAKACSWRSESAA